MSERFVKTMNRGGPETGASLVEYVLLLSLIALVCVVAVGFLGGQTQAPYEELASRLG